MAEYTEKDRDLLFGIAERVDTMYGLQNKLIKSHNDLIGGLTKKPEPAKPSSEEDASYFASKILSEVYPYEVEWGEYKTAEKPPAGLMIGDIFNTNNITSFFGNIPFVPEGLGLIMKMFGRNPRNEYQTTMNWIDKQRKTIPELYDDFETGEVDKGTVKKYVSDLLKEEEELKNAFKNKKIEYRGQFLNS